MAFCCIFISRYTSSECHITNGQGVGTAIRRASMYGRTRRNLIVAATGVGKVVISGSDYKRFRARSRSKSLNFLIELHEHAKYLSTKCFLSTEFLTRK